MLMIVLACGNSPRLYTYVEGYLASHCDITEATGHAQNMQKQQNKAHRHTGSEFKKRN